MEDELPMKVILRRIREAYADEGWPIEPGRGHEQCEPARQLKRPRGAEPTQSWRRISWSAPRWAGT